MDETTAATVRTMVATARVTVPAVNAFFWNKHSRVLAPVRPLVIPTDFRNSATLGLTTGGSFFVGFKRIGNWRRPDSINNEDFTLGHDLPFAKTSDEDWMAKRPDEFGDDKVDLARLEKLLDSKFKLFFVAETLMSALK